MCSDRIEAARVLEDENCDILLSDDGLKHYRLARDIEIAVVQRPLGIGNGRLLPAGPLREPVTVGLARADLVLSIGAAAAQASFRSLWSAAIHLPHLTGELVVLPMGMGWRGERVVAFAGIGRPAKFFATLRAEGAVVVRAVALDDHQPLSETLLKRLEFEAMAAGAQLVTTEKDATRLPAAYRTRVLTLPVRLRLQDWTAIDAALSQLNL